MRLIILLAANGRGEPTPDGVQRVRVIWRRQLDEFAEPVETLLIVANFVGELSKFNHNL